MCVHEVVAKKIISCPIAKRGMYIGEERGVWGYVTTIFFCLSTRPALLLTINDIRFPLGTKFAKSSQGRYTVCVGVIFVLLTFRHRPPDFFSYSLQMVCKYDIVGMNEVFLPLASLQIIRVRLWIRPRKGLDNNYCTSQFSANNIFGFFVFFCSSLFPRGGRRQ